MRAMFSGLLRSSRPALIVAVLVGVVGLTGTAYADKSNTKTAKNAKAAKHHAKAKAHASSKDKSKGDSKNDSKNAPQNSSQGDSKKSHGNDDDNGDWNGGSGYKHKKHHKVVPDGGLIHVDEDTPGITFSNQSVKLTGHGLVFGPYTNNSAGDFTSGGTVTIAVPAGTTLADVAQLEYSASFSSTAPAPGLGDAPYLRVFIDNDGDGFDFATAGDPGSDDHDIVFSPSTQPGACHPYPQQNTFVAPLPPAEIQCGSAGRMIHYVVTDGTARYDDDPGAISTSEHRWGEVVNAHATDKVESIRVSIGNSLPGTTGAVLNSLFFELAGHSPTTLAFAG